MDKISRIKQELCIETSEELFGIDLQPDEQCPKIDKYLSINDNAINWVTEYVKDIKKTEDLDDIYKYADDIEWELDSLNAESSLEEIRNKCGSVRYWGQQWKDLAKKLLNERESLIDLVGDKYLSAFESLEIK